MAKQKKLINIEVLRYDDHEMAGVLVNNKIVFQGNYWDFHSGCHGTKIGGYELKGKWDEGVESLATALAYVILEKDGVKAKIVNRNLTKEEHDELFGS
jgi:hypothetical protein